VRDFDKDVQCFDFPGQKAIDELEVGDCVEVNHNGERFWTKFVEFCGPCDIVATVLSALVFDHPFTTGDNIKFAKWNVYSIDKECTKWKL
jgi:hypothetical protein